MNLKSNFLHYQKILKHREKRCFFCQKKVRELFFFNLLKPQIKDVITKVKEFHKNSEYKKIVGEHNFKYKLDENGERITNEKTGEFITITEDYFETLHMTDKESVKDYHIQTPEEGADWENEITNNWTKYDIHYEKIEGSFIPYVHSLTFDRELSNMSGEHIISDTLSLYVYTTDTYVVLTRDQRMSAIGAFEETQRCDENGTLEVWIRNNPWYVEVEKFDDITGFNDYQFTTRSQSMDGIYYLIRSDERSNYAIWEDLAKFDFYNKNDFDGQLKLLYEDFTVESGIKYKYALQRESLKGYRTPPKFEFNSLENSPAHWSNFQYTYIYANGIQVRLDLDVKIQQFKHTRLFQKQDPLNSKYPVILKNGLANYGEFSLGGKITLHSDEAGSFLLHKAAEKPLS